MNMRNFDGNYLITCMFQMDFIDIHQVLTSQEVTITSFVYELITLYGDVKRNTFFSSLINLRQRGPIANNIKYFQRLSLRVMNIP